MAVRKADLEPKTTPPPRPREAIIEEQTRRLEVFLDGMLRSGTRLFPFDMLPKVVPPLTDKENRELVRTLKQKYEAAGWTISLDQTPRTQSDEPGWVSAWIFS